MTKQNVSLNLYHYCKHDTILVVESAIKLQVMDASLPASSPKLLATPSGAPDTKKVEPGTSGVNNMAADGVIGGKAQLSPGSSAGSPPLNSRLCDQLWQVMFRDSHDARQQE